MKHREILWLSVLWAVLPAIPAIVSGEIIGSPYTDLYSSVWSLHIPWMDTSGIIHTSWLQHPQGQEIYSSAYLKSGLSWILSFVFSPAQSYNLLIILSRFLGPLFAFHAGRAWGYPHHASIALAVCFAMSPYFHGYAVEGIIEGVDAWPLALWLWSCKWKKKRWMPLSLALCLYMSWYLGAAACLLTIILAVQHRRIVYSLLGILLACPAIYAFVLAHPNMGSIPAEIRIAMSATLAIPTPNILESNNLFAKNNYIGWSVILLSIRSVYARWALIPLLLSFGWGTELPILSTVRFPYRWHAATMLLLGMAVADSIQKIGWKWLHYLILMEFLLLSDMPPILPSSSAAVPVIYTHVDRPVLDVPGPLSIPAGQHNPSRQRSSYLLYAQLYHQQPSIWAYDFNGIHQTQEDSPLRSWMTWDPIQKIDPIGIGKTEQQYLQSIHASVVIHRQKIGYNRSQRLKKNLLSLGFILKEENDTHLLFLP